MYLWLNLKVMKKITVRKSWSEVTLREHIEIGKVETNKDLKDRPIAKRMGMLHIISNQTEQEIDEIQGQNLAMILNATDFLNGMPPKRKVKVFKLNGIDYMFHPKPNELSAGEMVSVEQYMIDEKNTGENRYAEIISILIRPCNKVMNDEFKKEVWTIDKFDTKNLDERKDMFLDKLTADKYMNEMAFFLSLGEKSKKLFHSSIQNPAKRRT